MTLVDAGPLVALLHRDDRNHARCSDALRSLRPPLGTVWPVVTEAMYLLAFSWKAQDRLWDLLQSERLRLLTLDSGDVPRMRALMQQYRDLPMDLADAALVRLAEREDLNRIFTIDRRDFSVYKLPRRRSFVIIP
jgi:predicted nucleic acid-binding protein